MTEQFEVLPVQLQSRQFAVVDVLRAIEPMQMEMTGRQLTALGSGPLGEGRPFLRGLLNAFGALVTVPCTCHPDRERSVFGVRAIIQAMDQALFTWWDALPEQRRQESLAMRREVAPAWIITSLRAAGVPQSEFTFDPLTDDVWQFLDLQSWWATLGEEDRGESVRTVDSPNAPGRLLHSLATSDRVPGPVASFRHPEDPIPTASSEFPRFVKEFIVGTARAHSDRPGDVEVLDLDRRRANQIREHIASEQESDRDVERMNPIPEGGSYPEIVDREAEIDAIRAEAQAEGRLWHLVRASC